MTTFSTPNHCRLVRRFAGVVIVAAVILLAASSPGDDHLQDLGAYQPNFFAELQDVELADGYAFVFGVGGMAIMDIDDPVAPTLVGRFQPQGHPYSRFYRGAIGESSYAYAGAREDRISVIDFNIAFDPVLTAIVGTERMSYEGMEVAGGYLFAARHADGLEIFDLAQPGLPVSTAEVTSLVNTWDLVIRDGLAYVADGVGGLAILDVTDPTQPVHLVSHPTAGAAVDVDLSGDLAVVACGSAGVEVLDISDPGAVVWRGNYDSSGLAITLDVVGTRVFLADWDDVEVIDVSIPESPSQIGVENTPVRAMGLAAASDDRVYVADWSRFRRYEYGPTLAGDVNLALGSIDFGAVPVGSTVDTTFTVANTGGGSLFVDNVESFGANFTVLPPVSFVLAPGESREMVLEYTQAAAGYDATFIRIDSGDTDENPVTFPVSANDDPSSLDLGEPAPDFTMPDMDGVMHSLSDYLGKVVVLAFFANW